MIWQLVSVLKSFKTCPKIPECYRHNSGKMTRYLKTMVVTQQFSPRNCLANGKGSEWLCGCAVYMALQGKWPTYNLKMESLKELATNRLDLHFPVWSITAVSERPFVNHRHFTE